MCVFKNAKRLLGRCFKKLSLMTLTNIDGMVFSEKNGMQNYIYSMIFLKDNFTDV